MYMYIGVLYANRRSPHRPIATWPRMYGQWANKQLHSPDTRADDWGSRRAPIPCSEKLDSEARLELPSRPVLIGFEKAWRDYPSIFHSITPAQKLGVGLKGSKIWLRYLG